MTDSHCCLITWDTYWHTAILGTATMLNYLRHVLAYCNMTDSHCCLITWDTYLHTLHMEQIKFLEAIHFPANHKFSFFLLKPNFHYHIHKFTSPVPIHRQLNPVHAHTSRYLKIHRFIIFTSKLFPSNRPFTSVSINENLHMPLVKDTTVLLMPTSLM